MKNSPALEKFLEFAAERQLHMICWLKFNEETRMSLNGVVLGYDGENLRLRLDDPDSTENREVMAGIETFKIIAQGKYQERSELFFDSLLRRDNVG